MKDVLIMSYEGNVRINDVPQNVKENKLIDAARLLLQEKLQKPLVDLMNVTYLKNSEIYDYLEKHFGGAIDTPEDFYDVRVKYEDIE